MKDRKSNRQVSVSQAHGTAAVVAERADSDGTFRGRPLWRILRPDGQHGAQLTTDARQVVMLEVNHVAHDD